MAIDNPYKMQRRDMLLRIMTAPNAGAHNAVYRGKALGSAVTDAQWAAIAAGTFDDLYIGDYWVKDGIHYRLGAFDYFLHAGDSELKTHHVVIVPDECLYTTKMNSTNTTEGGYVGSEMYKTGLDAAKNTIKGAFEDHLLKYRLRLSNAVTNGRTSDTAFVDAEVCLLNEQMVYGGSIFMPTSDGTNVPMNHREGKSQLPLFNHDPICICNRSTWFLQDVTSGNSFSCVGGDGAAGYSFANIVRGVRPYFLIG